MPQKFIRIYYINTSEIPGFFLLLKNHILIARSENTSEIPGFFLLLKNHILIARSEDTRDL